MLMQNFLSDRRSVREFRNKKASKDMLQELSKDIDAILSEAKFADVNIGLTLYTEGDNIYNTLKDIGGYSGIMIKSPHYIGLEILDDKECTEIYASYYTEKLISRINAIGLEACWITLNHVGSDTRQQAFGEKGTHTDYALSIGYPPRNNPFVKGPTASERMGVDELVFEDTVETPINMDLLDSRSIDDLFYYARFAPSSRNSQPWRFLLKDNRVKLLMAYCSKSDISLIDAGVMMYYFEELAKSIGISHKWRLIDGTCEGNLANYKYIAEFDL